MHCRDCDVYYNETFATPLAGLNTPLSRIITILTARTEGLGLNAADRTFQVSKKSILDWEQRLSNLKPTLILYSLLHQFIHQTIEGDELYTKVHENRPPALSDGWTIVLSGYSAASTQTFIFINSIGPKLLIKATSVASRP